MKNQAPPKNIKIVFFGTSDFAVPALKGLLNFGYEISAVVTQPEKPVGRAKVIIPSPIKKAALEKDVPVFEPHNLRTDEDFLHKFNHLKPDLCIVAAYGKIIPPKYLELPRYGFINIHPSALPKYRGPSPIQAAIMNGDAETAVAIMKIDEEMDHGPILGSSKYQVVSSKGYQEIEKELAELGAETLIDTLPKYISGEIKAQEQDHSKATFTKLLEREDGRIYWNKKSEEIFNKIRALNPQPGTWTTWNSKTLNIKEAELTTSEVDNGLEIGAVIKLNNNVAVATKKCYLILKQIQLEGGKEMDAKSFINGHPDFLNSKLE